MIRCILRHRASNAILIGADPAGNLAWSDDKSSYPLPAYCRAFADAKALNEAVGFEVDLAAYELVPIKTKFNKFDAVWMHEAIAATGTKPWNFICWSEA